LVLQSFLKGVKINKILNKAIKKDDLNKINFERFKKDKNVKYPF